MGREDLEFLETFSVLYCFLNDSHTKYFTNIHLISFVNCKDPWERKMIALSGPLTIMELGMAGIWLPNLTQTISSSFPDQLAESNSQQYQRMQRPDTGGLSWAWNHEVMIYMYFPIFLEKTLTYVQGALNKTN